jgi:uncharacterized protein
MRVIDAPNSTRQPTGLLLGWRRGLTLAMACASFLGASPSLAQTPQALPTTTLRAGVHNIVAQVAQNDEQRQTGLMHRKTMPAHEGMLFIFDAASVQCFWMKNTPLPLDIAMSSGSGVFFIQKHCTKQPVRYVLEMNEGWFKKRNINAGYKLTGTPFKSAVSK